MFVVLEWNQASGRPRVYNIDLLDTLLDANEVAEAARAASSALGRRERYTVHELDMEEAEA